MQGNVLYRGGKIAACLIQVPTCNNKRFIIFGFVRRANGMRHFPTIFIILKFPYKDKNKAPQTTTRVVSKIGIIWTPRMTALIAYFAIFKHRYPFFALFLVNLWKMERNGETKWPNQSKLVRVSAFSALLIVWCFASASVSRSDGNGAALLIIKYHRSTCSGLRWRKSGR